MSTRTIAFLHAINVEGRLVANSTLRDLFVEMGFGNVRTFISTGNVVFDLPTRPTQLMAKKIEDHLQANLGFDVPTFLRTQAEVQAIVRHRAFDAATMAAAKEMHVGFVAIPLSSEAVQRLMALRTPLDQFHVDGRDIYWLCRSRRTASDFSSQAFQKTLRVPATFRPLSTLLRLLPWIDSGRPSASRLGKPSGS
jgi:uncharacterized protein (DUF1697 family)